jgi:hypothetical protein
LLVEAPLMLIAMFFSARWAMRLATVRSARSGFAIGIVGLGLLLPVEFLGAVAIRGLSVEAYVASFATPAGAASAALFLVFAAAPTLTLWADGERHR